MSLFTSVIQGWGPIADLSCSTLSVLGCGYASPASTDSNGGGGASVRVGHGRALMSSDALNVKLRESLSCIALKDLP
eukprot:653464-Prorocentrum_minimum.AAC.1